MKEWKVMTVNMSGGRHTCEWALQQDVRILLVQEHKGTNDKVASYQTLAAKYKWNGVWTEALEKSATGRSGGGRHLRRSPNPCG